MIPICNCLQSISVSCTIQRCKLAMAAFQLKISIRLQMGLKIMTKFLQSTQWLFKHSWSISIFGNWSQHFLRSPWGVWSAQSLSSLQHIVMPSMLIAFGFSLGQILIWDASCLRNLPEWSLVSLKPKLLVPIPLFWLISILNLQTKLCLSSHDVSITLLSKSSGLITDNVSRLIPFNLKFLCW